MLSTEVLLFRLWEGNALVPCGRQSPFVASKCICGGTLPYICWISESISAKRVNWVYFTDSFTAQVTNCKKTHGKILMPWFDVLWDHSFPQLSGFPSTSPQWAPGFNALYFEPDMNPRIIGQTSLGTWRVEGFSVLDIHWTSWKPPQKKLKLHGINGFTMVYHYYSNISRIFDMNLPKQGWFNESFNCLPQNYSNLSVLARGIVGWSSHYALQRKASYCCSLGSDAVIGRRAYWAVATSCWLYLGSSQCLKCWELPS